MSALKIAIPIVLCLALFGAYRLFSKESAANKKVPVEDITEFYYTLEDINFDAFYQRYRFYLEDGKRMFYHERRERPGEYGPATEKDIVSSGTLELSDEAWNEFLAFMEDGVVSARNDSAEAGGSGPWMFVYWKGDEGKYQVFEFSSYETRLRFEDLCSSIAQGKR